MKGIFLFYAHINKTGQVKTYPVKQSISMN